MTTRRRERPPPHTHTNQHTPPTHTENNVAHLQTPPPPPPLRVKESSRRPPEVCPGVCNLALFQNPHRSGQRSSKGTRAHTRDAQITSPTPTQRKARLTSLRAVRSSALRSSFFRPLADPGARQLALPASGAGSGTAPTTKRRDAPKKRTTEIPIPEERAHERGRRQSAPRVANSAEPSSAQAEKGLERGAECTARPQRCSASAQRSGAQGTPRQTKRPRASSLEAFRNGERETALGESRAAESDRNGARGAHEPWEGRAAAGVREVGRRERRIGPKNGQSSTKGRGRREGGREGGRQRDGRGEGRERGREMGGGKDAHRSRKGKRRAACMGYWGEGGK